MDVRNRLLRPVFSLFIAFVTPGAVTADGSQPSANDACKAPMEAAAGPTFEKQVPKNIEVARNEPWEIVIDDWYTEDKTNFLNRFLRNEALAPVASFLGIKWHRDRDKIWISVPPPAEFNANLKALGCPFRITAVPGKINLEPWIDMNAQRIIPVGDNHDLSVHGIAMWLIPKKLGLAYSAQLGLLQHVEKLPDLPDSARKLFRSNMGTVAERFEETVYISADIANGQNRSVASWYKTVLGLDLIGGDREKGSAGAPAIVSRLKVEILRNWKNLGFSDNRSAKAMNEKLDSLLARLQANDPAFSVTVPASEFELLVSERLLELSRFRGGHESRQGDH